MMVPAASGGMPPWVRELSIGHRVIQPLLQEGRPVGDYTQRQPEWAPEPAEEAPETLGFTLHDQSVWISWEGHGRVTTATALGGITFWGASTAGGPRWDSIVEALVRETDPARRRRRRRP